MIKKVEMYKAYDMSIHPSREKARDHALNAARELISNTLTPLVGDLGRSKQFKVVMQFIPDDPEAAKALIKDLYKILTYGDDDNEENY